MPKPGLNDTPRLFVQHTGLRGGMAWETWVEHGLSKFGTFAWTRKQAKRKGRRLMAKWQRLHAAEATREEIRVDG